MFRPILLALSQLDDPVFRGVIWRSVVWSLLALGMLFGGSFWAVRHYMHFAGQFAAIGDFIALVTAGTIAAFLFLPFAALLGAAYMERIANAVERRHYPALPRPQGVSLMDQSVDGINVGIKVMVLSVVGLIVTLLLPGVGFFVGWAIAAYGLGRGLFVAVAMRRLPRIEAETVYRSNRDVAWAAGAILAIASYVPLLNFLVPVIGTAAMVHAFDIAVSRSGGGSANRSS